MAGGMNKDGVWIAEMSSIKIDKKMLEIGVLKSLPLKEMPYPLIGPSATLHPQSTDFIFVTGIDASK